MLENKETGEGLSSSSAQVTIESRGLDPWTLYLYAMKSPATKEKYLMRLGKFLDFSTFRKEEHLKINHKPFQRKEEMIMFGPSTTFLGLQLLKERVDRKE